MKYRYCVLTFLLLHTAHLLFAQQNIADSLLYQNLQRQYIVHTPPGYSGAQDRPLVITLHGGSGTYNGIQPFSEMNTYSNQNGFLVCYPQGAGIASPGYSWADGRNTSADQAGIDDVGFIDRLIDQLLLDFAIDADSIYVCGYSNGGFMTQRLACELTDRFAAIGGLGCSLDTMLYQSCQPLRAIPMFYAAGTADPEVPYQGGPMNNPAVTPIVPIDSAVGFWVQQNNCRTAEPVLNVPDTVLSDSSTVQLFRWTDCDCNAEVYFYKIIGGGHTWPGVQVPGFPQLGPTNEDIHGSAELWKFFRRHSRCNLQTSIEPQTSTIPFAIYPNPASDVLHVSAVTGTALVEIFDGTGTLILRGATGKLDIQHLPAGYYLVRIQNGVDYTTHKLLVD